MKKDIVLDSKNIPLHVACIMDGNGRWAKKRGLARTIGHKYGIDRVKEIIIESKNIGIKVLTVFAFSTDNWKRSKQEINDIFALLERMLEREKDFFIRENIRVKIIGTLDRLNNGYASLKRKIESIIKETENNSSFTFNIAFNYGGRDEIISAIKNISLDVKNNQLSIEEIDNALFEKYLMTYGLENVDLMIRTSGECRLSNFMLWQIAYSELCFVDTYWPDFNKDRFIECIYQYQRRERRFGGIK